MPDTYPRCPECGAALQWHSLTEWCLTCGYARNLHPDPDTGEQIVRHGSRWEWLSTCLNCGDRPATHRFAVLGGPSGWLCDRHKDSPVTINGVTYGDQERR